MFQGTQKKNAPTDKIWCDGGQSKSILDGSNPPCMVLLSTFKNSEIGFCRLSSYLQGGFDPTKSDFDWLPLHQILSVGAEFFFLEFLGSFEYTIYMEIPYFIENEEQH